VDVRDHPDKPFARYTDEAVAHCRSMKDAEKLHESLKRRFVECGLELHPDKTRIVYCKDDDRWGNHPEIKCDFLGYTFRARRSRNKYGKHFINFTPAVRNKAKKAVRQTIHDLRMHLKPDKNLEDLSRCSTWL
jgi:RNA-directed DNA polymerase